MKHAINVVQVSLDNKLEFAGFPDDGDQWWITLKVGEVEAYFPFYMLEEFVYKIYDSGSICLTHTPRLSGNITNSIEYIEEGPGLVRIKTTDTDDKQNCFSVQGDVDEFVHVYREFLKKDYVKHIK